MGGFIQVVMTKPSTLRAPASKDGGEKPTPPIILKGSGLKPSSMTLRSPTMRPLRSNVE
jgi:hypothetical protein